MSTITPEDEARVKAAVESLIEHFDSVRIFIVKHDGANDKTEAYSRGKGNYFAQLGAVRDWLVARDGETLRGETDAE